ncbi:MAG: SprT-like domain-containing protein [Prevotellaceae bacterium]|nr:SprT-like domain-containing protein [Prevotellaceae bacterium]
MKADITYIKKKFEEFNKQMFAGKLPMLPIELSNAKTFLGQCVFKIRRLPNGRTEKYDFRLRINTRVDLSEQELEDTVIHEMIHYYIGINQLNDTSAHGQIFRRIMDDINVKYGRHLTITHKVTKEQREQAYEKRQRWHVVAVVEFKDGKTGLKVLPRIVPRILNYYNNIGAHDRVSDIKLYMSNDIFFNRFPNSGALNATYVDAKELQEHLSDAKKLLCNGKQIRKI